MGGRGAATKAPRPSLLFTSYCHPLLGTFAVRRFGDLDDLGPSSTASLLGGMHEFNRGGPWTLFANLSRKVDSASDTQAIEVRIQHAVRMKIDLAAVRRFQKSIVHLGK